MKTKLLITESDKNNILKMYGLIKEDVDQELVNYGNNYIDNNSCDQIYNDLRRFQSAVNSGQVPMNDRDKNELDSNLKQMKLAKEFACPTIKKKMKETFAKESRENPDKLKASMCWFAQNITNTSLSSCSSKPISNPVNSPKIETPKIDSPKVDIPKIDSPKVDFPKVDTPPPSKSLYDRMSTPQEYNKNLRSGRNNQDVDQQRTKISTTKTKGSIFTTPQTNSIKIQ
jgi:hypothetical protein